MSKAAQNLTTAEDIIKEALTKLDHLAAMTSSPVVRDYAKFMRRDTSQASHIHSTRLRLKIKK